MNREKCRAASTAKMEYAQPELGGDAILTSTGSWCPRRKPIWGRGRPWSKGGRSFRRSKFPTFLCIGSERFIAIFEHTSIIQNIPPAPLGGKWGAI